MEQQVEASVYAAVPFERATAVFSEEPEVLLGEVGARGGPMVIRLDADIGSGSGAYQDVTIELGSLHHAGEAVELDVAWWPTGHARIIPSFHGSVRLQPVQRGAQLSVKGSYRPPLGVFGGVADKVVGHRLANNALSHLARSMGRRLEAEVERQVSSVAWHPAAYPEANARSEYYCG